MLKRNKLRIGPILRGDSAYEGDFRVSQQGDLVKADGHATYYELTARQKMYTATTALTGTTIVSGNVAPPAAAAATVLSVLNPIGSGVDVVINVGWVAQLSGNAVAGFWAWCGCNPGVAITAAQNAPGTNHYISPLGSQAQAWTQTALSGGIAQNLVRPFVAAGFAAAIAATTDQQLMVDFVDGAIVLPPGALISLAPSGVDGVTPLVAAAGIQWGESLRPLRAP